MNYIVLDMEWNQPWPGSPSAKKVLPVQIRGEIIQIGAVRVTEEQQVTDEFQVLIKPKYYRHLNRRVSKLTGIKESRLKEEGVPMKEAMAAFREWCGEDIVFLTWGFDDIGILMYGVMSLNGDTFFLCSTMIVLVLYLEKRGVAVEVCPDTDFFPYGPAAMVHGVHLAILRVEVSGVVASDAFAVNFLNVVFSFDCRQECKQLLGRSHEFRVCPVHELYARHLLQCYGRQCLDALCYSCMQFLHQCLIVPKSGVRNGKYMKVFQMSVIFNIKY